MTPSPEPELPFFVPDDYDTSDFKLPRIWCRCGVLRFDYAEETQETLLGTTEVEPVAPRQSRPDPLAPH